MPARCACSCLYGDEPAAGKQGPASSELLRLEEAFVHLPVGAVGQDPFLPLDRLGVVGERGVDDDELRRHAPRLAEEDAALRLLEVPVEEAREDTLERAVLERQVERVGARELDIGKPAGRELEHRLTLVEAGDLTR